MNLTVGTTINLTRLSRPGYITVKGVKGNFAGDGDVDIGDAAKIAYHHHLAGKIKAL